GTTPPQEGLDDSPTPVPRAATLRQEEPRGVSRVVVPVQLRQELGLHNPNLRGQRVGNLKLTAANGLADHSSVDQDVSVLSQGRGNQEDKPRDPNRTPVVTLLLDLRKRSEEGVEGERSVRRNVGLRARHITERSGGAGLKNVAVRRVEVRGADPVRADKLEVGQGLLRVHSKPDHLSWEAGDLVPLVVDERLEGEVDTRTVLVRGKPLLALAVLEGRVGGQLGNPRKPNLPSLAT